jgi:D-beta-D-heptose 7-phosphate kinase/D-beta-D-heptose 1-phosphate adenosyltransferase
MSISASNVNSVALLATLAKCVGKSIMVIGDVMLDEYVSGTVERISPEAPVPVLHAGDTQFRLGGAANVARQILALGAQVTLIGTIGEDEAGMNVRRLCEEEGISAAALHVIRGRRTSRKIRILSQSQQLLRIDWEDRAALVRSDVEALMAHVGQAAPPDAVMVSDYAKGVVTPALFATLARLPSLQSKPVVVDPKERDFSRYQGASVLTPNLRELGAAVGYSLDADDRSKIVAAARSQIAIGQFQAMAVTMGDRGVLVIFAEGREVLIPALKRAVYDVTGAGDTAAAVLATCLSTGSNLEAAAAIGNAAAGIAVGEIGAVAVPAAQIADALTGADANKILSRSQLERRIFDWRRQNQRIVFTNGCFDLLHAGHLSLLTFAKSQGDKLVLAINSDAAVRRLKGPTRPVVSQQDRAAMLGALGCVDAVTIFDEDTPLETIRCVQPQVLVKGQDYRLDEVIGRQLVEAAGGRVILAPLLGSYSTTSLLARARG